MKLSRPLGFALLILFVLGLAACSSSLEADPNDEPNLTQAIEPVSAPITSTENTSWWVEDVPRADEQGAVSVVVTPLNLNNAWESIDFRVAMNTHSVDLSMDLAALASLTTDTGLTVQALSWDAPLGGHHVSGKLIFPTTVESGNLLDGANQITLTLREVDAPERLFVWQR